MSNYGSTGAAEEGKVGGDGDGAEAGFFTGDDGFFVDDHLPPNDNGNNNNIRNEGAHSPGTHAAVAARTRPQPAKVDNLNDMEGTQTNEQTSSKASLLDKYTRIGSSSSERMGMASSDSDSRVAGSSSTEDVSRPIRRDDSSNWLGQYSTSPQRDQKPSVPPPVSSPGTLPREGGGEWADHDRMGRKKRAPKERGQKNWLPDRKTLLYRTKVTLRETQTAFWCGALWQYFGWQFAGQNSSGTQHDVSPTYWLATGCGDAVGYMVGFLTTQVARYYIFGDGSLREGAFPVTTLLEGFEIACLMSFGNFCSGFTWQPALSMATLSGLNFNEAFGIVWMMCSMAYLLGITLMRLVVGFVFKLEALTPRGNPSTLQRDFSMAMSIGSGAAFFTATDAEEEDNWLGHYFGYDIYSNTSIFFGVVKAGLSVATGFFLFQTLQNCLTSPGETWTDIAGLDVVEDAEGHRVFRLQRFQSQQVQSSMVKDNQQGSSRGEEPSTNYPSTDNFNLANPFSPLRTYPRTRSGGAIRGLGNLDRASSHF